MTTIKGIRKKLFILLLGWFAQADYLYGQQSSSLIDELVNDIEASQVRQDGEFYSGMFPSYRKCAGLPHNFQPDNNIFYTAISAFTLNNLVACLNESNQTKVLKIIKNAEAAYPHYRNGNGKPYYNFWPQHSPILPHSFFIGRLTGIFGQGDDADDSAMVLMASVNNDMDNKALKERLIEVSNLKIRKINSTFRKYRDIPSYSTYLGIRMHPDFDFGVLCNILYFNFEKKLPLVKQDSATIYLLSEILLNREYMKRPVYISPSYVKPSVLIYHVARLMGSFKINELELFKDQLIADAKKLMIKPKNIMEGIILRTSLIRLGCPVPDLSIRAMDDFEKTDQHKFSFFQARAAFAQPTPIKQIFLHWSPINYLFYSHTYNKVLWLEYLVLRDNFLKDQLN